MWGARKRSHDLQGLEARLRSHRPEAKDEFVRAVSAKVAPRRGSYVGSRLAFAAAFTTLVLGTFVSMGGIGYTTAGASHAYQTVKDLAATEDVTIDRSSAADQYGPPPAPPDQGAAPEEVTEAAAAEGGTSTSFNAQSTRTATLHPKRSNSGERTCSSCATKPRSTAACRLSSTASSTRCSATLFARRAAVGAAALSGAAKAQAIAGRRSSPEPEADRLRWACRRGRRRA